MITWGWCFRWISSFLDLSCLYELHCGIFDLNDLFIRLVGQYLIYCGLFSLFSLDHLIFVLHQAGVTDTYVKS